MFNSYEMDAKVLRRERYKIKNDYKKADSDKINTRRKERDTKEGYQRIVDELTLRYSEHAETTVPVPSKKAAKETAKKPTKKGCEKPAKEEGEKPTKKGPSTQVFEEGQGQMIHLPESPVMLAQKKHRDLVFAKKQKTHRPKIFLPKKVGTRDAVNDKVFYGYKDMTDMTHDMDDFMTAQWFIQDYMMDDYCNNTACHAWRKRGMVHYGQFPGTIDLWLYKENIYGNLEFPFIMYYLV
jgi:hypothetical protein